MTKDRKQSEDSKLNKSISPRLPAKAVSKQQSTTSKDKKEKRPLDNDSKLEVKTDKSKSPRLRPVTNKKKGNNKVAFDLPKSKQSVKNKKKSEMKS